MSEKMLKFVGIKKETPSKIDAKERVSNFHEIYKEFIENKASEQASSVANVEHHFVRFIVHYITIFQTG